MQSTILIAREYGTPDVLEFFDQALPELAAGMARIKVKAAGINPIDARRMTGEFRHAALPQGFGTEFAGVIVDLPAGASHWATGDEVLGSGAGFTHATVIDVPLSNLVARPANIDWPVAGSLAGVAQTAMTILDEIGDVRSLLIHGGSGGVGSITIQIARARGIEVVATASARNLGYLAELGATPVEYGPGLVARLEAVHPALFDASLDMSGTEEATQASLARVRPDGLIGSIAGTPPSSERVQALWTKRSPAKLKAVVDGVAAGRFRWEVSKTFPFSDAADAYGAILGGHTRGKSALVF
ncbi:NADP-dependent oxidoreductase [Salipiger mangrovisoli]|uniref:NADP-dependent oxidoreductase n=1 Tax=Salipiger mangrovisoli TaxID=2865933 RepID=A0ABR9X2L5_9RHOB|nr:NADP-dependent oxidoreductase [Salipiger mangrovisoli]MBE9637804.1 NADP-dependent oxidoreductase [Salipiger mangrovisoli]